MRSSSVFAGPLGLLCLAVSASHIVHFTNDSMPFHFAFILPFGALGALLLYCPFRLWTHDDRIGRHLYSLFAATVYVHVTLILSVMVFPRSAHYPQWFEMLVIGLWLVSILIIYLMTLRKVTRSD
jgi:uncharacterized membrane protein YhdT